MNDGLTTWLMSIAAGLIVGLAKTGLPGCGILAVPLMAMIFPAKLSVGALLPLLIAGDLCAVTFYHRHAQWKKLLELFPCVLGGIALGAIVLWKIDSAQLKPLLGVLILSLLGLELARQRFGWSNFPHKMWFVILMGSLAGFATTLGNVAGPIMSIYFISKGFKKDEFMGTAAWYFLIFNCVKIPIYGGLGMISQTTLKFDLFIIPAVLAGALIGRLLLGMVPQRVFNFTVLFLAAIAAGRLLM
ncbi:MAG: sulfite exporter TauE/SafE family protein [Kiritimatiellia bacterium]|nr:sulfite exporter TauE/SafE family protein [Kiritimatiellia bacterium]